MKKLLFICAAIALMSGFSGKVMAQADILTADHSITFDIPAMKLVGVVGNAPALSLEQPTAAGKPIAAVSTAGDCYLQYTSVVADGAAGTNEITVHMASAMPAATTLEVQAGTDAGSGSGTIGTPSTKTIGLVQGSAEPLIADIGSCFTGDGLTDGHPLTYTWTVNGDYADLDITAEKSILITYTIQAE